MNENVKALDDLMESVQRAIDRAKVSATAGGDAIDQELSTPGRTTNVVSVRDSETVKVFRQEMVDGLIRLDTANQLLRFLQQVLTPLLAAG